jgi:hypothetical protein
VNRGSREHWTPHISVQYAHYMLRHEAREPEPEPPRPRPRPRPRSRRDFKLSECLTPGAVQCVLHRGGFTPLDLHLHRHLHARDSDTCLSEVITTASQVSRPFSPCLAALSVPSTRTWLPDPTRPDLTSPYGVPYLTLPISFPVLSSSMPSRLQVL